MPAGAPFVEDRSGRLLPNLVIAGAPRCGTSALFDYLASHPQVGVSSVKEVQYFTDPDSALYHPQANFRHGGLQGYAGFFPSAGTAPEGLRIVLEATPGYLYQKLALEQLPRLPGYPVFVFMLRRPSAQLRSSYLYSRNRAGNLPRDVSFREFALGSPAMMRSSNEFHRCALDFVRYADYVERWVDRCGEARIKIVIFETLMANLPVGMAELAQWLDIDPAPLRERDYTRINAGLSVRSPALQRLGRGLSAALLPASAMPLARRIYRLVNVAEHRPDDAGDSEVMAEIDARCAEANARLARRFGLDLSMWNPSGYT